MSERDLCVHTFETRHSVAWQDYVDCHPEGTFFHGLAWKQSIERTFCHRARYLVATRRGGKSRKSKTESRKPKAESRNLRSLETSRRGAEIAEKHVINPSLRPLHPCASAPLRLCVSSSQSAIRNPKSPKDVPVRRIVGVFPLFEVNSVLAGRLLVSVPYATYGGILADDEEVAVALFAEAKAIASQSRVRSIEVRSIRASVPLLGVQHSHAMFRKPLPDQAEDVLSVMPRKARAAARRAAERYELSVGFDRVLLPVVWQLYSRSMRRLGSPNYPYRFFEELSASTGDDCVVQLVRHQGRAVAGLVSFLYRDTVMPYFAGLDERESVYGLNNFLYAESMRWGVRQGYRMYDFGRTRIDNTGSYNFKRFCGFEPQQLEYQTYVMPGRTAPDLSPGSSRWIAARRMWKTLPLPITRPLGAWLAKSIPG